MTQEQQRSSPRSLLGGQIQGLPEASELVITENQEVRGLQSIQHHLSTPTS